LSKTYSEDRERSFYNPQTNDERIINQAGSPFAYPPEWNQSVNNNMFPNPYFHPAMMGYMTNNPNFPFFNPGNLIVYPEESLL